MKSIETERLILRSWTPTDLHDFYEYAKNPNVGPKAGWSPHQSKEESKQILNMFIEGESHNRAIVLKTSNQVIGSIEARKDPYRKRSTAVNIGYVLSFGHWNKGIMTEALNGLLHHLFTEEHIDIVSIEHAISNYASQKVILKNGFIHEGTLRKATVFEGEIDSCHVYSMTKDEWKNLK